MSQIFHWNLGSWNHRIAWVGGDLKKLLIPEVQLTTENGSLDVLFPIFTFFYFTSKLPLKILCWGLPRCFTFWCDPGLSVSLSWIGSLRPVSKTPKSHITELVQSGTWLAVPPKWWRICLPDQRKDPWTVLLHDDGVCISDEGTLQGRGWWSFSVTKTNHAIRVEQSSDQDLDSDLLEICEQSGSIWPGSTW